jgi:putative peptidoglycan lipid II flippase
MAPIMYNIGQIIGAIFLVPRFGIHGLVYGVILGAAFHLLIQIPALFRYEFKWTPALDLRHTGLIRALQLLGPRLLTMFGIQLIVIARDNIASRLDQVGAVTSLTYGWMIMQVPETLLGTAIATAMLPTLAELAAREDWSGFHITVERALRVLIALTIPGTVRGRSESLMRGLPSTQPHTLITWTTRLSPYADGFLVEIAARSLCAWNVFPLYAVFFDSSCSLRSSCGSDVLQAHQRARYCPAGSRCWLSPCPVWLAEQTDARTARVWARSAKA